MKTKTPFKRIVLGALLLAAVALVICGVIAVLVIKEVMTPKPSAILLQIVMMILVCVVCWHHAVKAGKTRMQISLGIGAAYTVLCALVGLAVVPEAEFQFNFWTFGPVAMAVIAGLISGAKRDRR